MPSFAVYIIACATSGKNYVGICKCGVDRRFTRHKEAARAGSTLLLHRAMRKYGFAAFSVAPIEYPASWEEAKAAERRYIAELDTFRPNGYNMTAGGDGTVDYRHTDDARQTMSRKHTGKVLSAETRARMSASRKGVPKSPEGAANIRAALALRPPLTPERLAKMHANRVNGPLSDEHKAKLSAALKGRKQDPAVVAARIPLVRAGMTLSARQKIIESNRRRPVTEATRQKMSKSLRAALADPEVKKKMAASNARRIWTDEARAKIGTAHRGKPKSPETREKMREAARRAHARRRNQESTA